MRLLIEFPWYENGNRINRFVKDLNLSFTVDINGKDYKRCAILETESTTELVKFILKYGEYFGIMYKIAFSNRDRENVFQNHNKIDFVFTLEDQDF